MNMTSNTSMHRTHPVARNGFSLLEVLIALVVLSVGLLGLAALQAEGLRGSSNAQQRFQAVRLASDIADRMRANEAGVNDYVILKTASAASGSANACADVGTTNATACTPTQMAAFDLFQWRQALDDVLTGGVGGIAVATDATTGNSIVTVTVEWTDRGTTQTILTGFEL